MKLRSSLVVWILATVAVASCTSTTGGSVSPMNTDSASIAHGIAGTVVKSPTVPVVREGEIDWAPLAGATIDIDRQNGDRVGYVVSDSAGRFFVDLPAGAYRLVPRALSEGMFPTPPGPQDVSVPAIGLVQVRIDYDTGIR